MATTTHKHPPYILIWVYLAVLTAAELGLAFELPISRNMKLLLLMILAVWKALLVALYFIVLQFVLVTAVALLFSSFSSPLLSAVFTFCLFIIGSFSGDLRSFASIAEGVPGVLASGLVYLVPNFSALNVVSAVAHGEAVAGRLILYNTLYALLYATAAIAASALIFERRNLK